MGNHEYEEGASPEEIAAGLEQFQLGGRHRRGTPEEEAALDLAIEIGDAQTAAIIGVLSEAPIAGQFPDKLRESVLRDLAHTLEMAAELNRTWREEIDPAELLAVSRSLRHSADGLTETIERLWPDQPPYDHWAALEG
jgi:hypothetical protein